MAFQNKPRLGKGLKGMIGAHLTHPVAPPAAASVHVPLIALNLVDNNPHQPRQAIEPGALHELVASIKANGVLQPVLVRPVGERYQLVAGHRRVEAARQAGLTHIPAVVRDAVTDQQQAQWALVENNQRENLNPIERGKAYKIIMESFGLTQTALSAALGEDRVSLTNYLRLLELPSGVQDLVARGLLSLGHAKILVGVDNRQQQDKLANLVIAEGWPVRKLEEYLQSAETEVTPSGAGGAIGLVKKTVKSPHVIDLEEQLRQRLGTKVTIKPSRNKTSGTIVITYASLDDFDRIVESVRPGSSRLQD
jgi:ParB family chromosome partitioning protein